MARDAHAEIRKHPTDGWCGMTGDKGEAVELSKLGRDGTEGLVLVHSGPVLMREDAAQAILAISMRTNETPELVLGRIATESLINDGQIPLWQRVCRWCGSETMVRLDDCGLCKQGGRTCCECGSTAARKLRRCSCGSMLVDPREVGA